MLPAELEQLPRLSTRAAARGVVAHGRRRRLSCTGWSSSRSLLVLSSFEKANDPGEACVFINFKDDGKSVSSNNHHHADVDTGRKLLINNLQLCELCVVDDEQQRPPSSLAPICLSRQCHHRSPSANATL